MAKKKTKRRKTAKRRRKNADLTMNIVGLVFVLLAILAIFRWGFLGNLFANTFRLFVGDTYLIAAVIFGMTGLYMLVLGHFPDRIPAKRLWGMILVYFSNLILGAEILFKHNEIHSQFLKMVWRLLQADFRRGRVTQSVGGGMIGTGAYTVTFFLASNWGTILIALIMMMAGLMLFTNLPFSDLVRILQKIAGWLQLGFQKTARGLRKFHDRFFQSKAELDQAQDQATATAPAQPTEAVEPAPAATSPADKSQTSVDTVMATTFASGTTSAPAEAETDEGLPLPHDGFDVHFTPTGGVVDAASKPQASAASDPVEAPAKTSRPVAPPETVAHHDYDHYQLPTTDLLSTIPPTDQSGEVALIQKNRATLDQTFRSFGVDVKIIHADLGPTVTKYEVKPGLGVKVNKIVNLADDLALALAAKDIRIEAPIPGKPYVGIEVPNRTIATVSFREVIEKQPRHPGKVLEVPLGKSVTGEVISADLTKMPHLLIAGSTGSGKSVMINVIITSILMHARPDQVKLMLIDPKMVELSIYNDIPHLLLPVVTEPKKAANALNKAVSEMEDRYQRFEAAGVRDIKEYNAKVHQNNSDKANPVMTEMPYLVIVIDELADLMMAAGNEVETAIVRLAQKARAAGVHLIIATQRPSVDVITGLIKANIPSRIAFAVSSGIDSRTILDMNGAEKLLGRGDMMYAPLGLSKPVRIQGAFISSKDVETISDFVKNQQDADYDEELIAHVNDVSEDGSSSEHDEHFSDAVAYVIQEDKASTSMIQRRFRIGYNRAALIIEDMEQMGVVGPSEGSKGRKVLWTLANYQQFIAATDT
ncbi:FtsK/SpoIIIE family DNA translocase [Lapidilactobacillus luobeiensis]|uniref:FtsK/SpoIIIE family DNA translocase n=1 Tax=Lapidilactobacillus luobeiensis TaxID=2950371 RepID=UPI0021C3E7E3|nr:DNA translocase FtsK [Lapidilactobacillus luobeiensis]